MLHRFSFAPVGFALLLASAASAGWAQEKCQQFRASTPLTFDNQLGTYTGPVYAVLGDEVLIGKTAGDTPPVTTCDGVSCQDTGGTMRLVFSSGGLMDPGDTFTIEVHTAVYSLPGGFGIYHATERVVGGTGRFLNATGMLFEQGPYIAWVDGKGQLQAQYNGEIGGSICGVKPAATRPATMFPLSHSLLSPGRRK